MSQPSQVTLLIVRSVNVLSFILLLLKIIALPNVKKDSIIRDIDNLEYLKKYIEATVVTTQNIFFLFK
jgi:hypothetical protein